MNGPERHPDELYPGIYDVTRYPDFDPHELYPPGGRVEAVTDETGESNVTIIRDAALAHAIRIASRNDYADRLAAVGLAMLPETETRWFGLR